MQTLVSDGYLAPTRTLRRKGGLDVAGRLNAKGEIKSKDQDDAITEQAVANAVDAYRDYTPQGRAIFFGVNRRHSELVCEEFRSKNIRAAHLDGEDSTGRRDRVVGEFEAGQLAVLGNCDLFSEGLDVVACDTIILGAPTRSVTKYLQAAGRAMRPLPGKVATIIDLEDIHKHLGLPDDIREWSLEDGEIAVRKGAKKKLHPCPQCEVLIYGNRCRHCGYLDPQVDDALDLGQRAEFEEVKAGGGKPPKAASRKEINRELYRARRSADPRLVLEEIAAARNYAPGWVGHIVRYWECGK